MAVHEFCAWTDGEFLGEWGVESLMTASCARALARTAKRTGATDTLTLEQSFAGILAFSDRETPPGRPSSARKRVDDKTSGRMDIVVWKDGVAPRVMIEIKRHSGIAGLTADAVRVIDFIRCAGKAYKGSVRYGLVATMFSGPAARGLDYVVGKADERIAKLAKLAKKHGMAFTYDGPQWIENLKSHKEVSACTYVFAFSPHRTPA